MQFQDAHDILESRLLLIDGLPKIIAPNDTELPESIFLLADYIPQRARSVGHAGQVSLEGIVQVSIMAPLNSPIYESEAIVTKISQAFPPNFEDQGVRVEHPVLPRGGYRDSGYWRTPVQIRWRSLPV